MGLDFAGGDYDVSYVRGVSVLNIFFLLAAGFFTILWPLLRISSVDFPATCSKTGFGLASMVRFYTHYICTVLTCMVGVLFS